MSRMEEYEAMLQQLEEIPAETENCVARAKARRSRSRVLWRPLASVAAVLCLFVGLVNVSPTVAAACKEIPLLESLVEALTFSPSLQKAVENDYIQPMGLEQTINDVTVRVEHVIVDQKQVNIFYTITSEVHKDMTAQADVWLADRDEPPSAAMTLGGSEVIPNEIRHITVDFTEDDVPSQLRLLVKVGKLADFEFLLTFDPKFTEQGKTVAVNQTFELDGNRFTLTELEIYPSHIRIDLAEEPDNPAWLSTLRFHLELDDGTVIESVSNGITAYGNPETPSMMTYMAESSYFYHARSIKIVVTGADFREKSFENVYVNLETGETGTMPPATEFLKAVRTSAGWEVSFLVEDHMQRSQSFTGMYDADGDPLDSRRFSNTHFDDVKREHIYYLDGYTGSEVWFEPNYTYFWTPEEPVVVEIKTPQ